MIAVNLLIFYAKIEYPFHLLISLISLIAFNSFILFLLYRSINQRMSLAFKKLSTELATRKSKNLELINHSDYPLEFKESLSEINELFKRLQIDFDRNKRFSADAAHELRTPMTALKTQAQLALEITEPEEQKKSIKNVIISINRSIHLIQQLLTLSRLDHEEKLNDITEINLEKISAELIAFMYPNALEKNIEIELSNESKSPMIEGNESALGILLRNLIDNAIRYTPNHGRIYVKIIDDDEHIILKIIDNGPGIPQEFQDKVFDRFFRVLGTKQTGSGLGLAIVKQIIDLHQAKIELQSSYKNHGLTAIIYFKKLKGI